MKPVVLKKLLYNVILPDNNSSKYELDGINSNDMDIKKNNINSNITKLFNKYLLQKKYLFLKSSNRNNINTAIEVVLLKVSE
ncbi:hypothetical protein LK25_00745 [Enterococcus faecium]|nr:hypothetical protein LK25_00745 [Enterococcus faecium]